MAGGELKEQIQQIVNDALRKLNILPADADRSSPGAAKAPDTADGAVPERAVYRDEPILQRASQLISDEHPPRYRQLRRMAADPEARRHSAAWLFCKQGAFMARFEDDFEYHGVFQRYYPTYQDMTILQQRGYFGWRTRVRRGDVQRTELSFVFVYIYELLNNIGVDSPEEGFETLRHFWSVYRGLDASIDPYLRRWMHDYVIYYGLDKSLLEDMGEGVRTDAVSVLLRPDIQSDEVLFRALCALSGYRVEVSRLYKKHPDKLRRVTCQTFRALTVFYEKHRKNTLVEKLFGRTVSGPWAPFEPAVFFDRFKYQDYTYTVSELEKYRCRCGIWTCERMYLNKDKSPALSAILKTVDSRLRERLGDCPPIQPGNTTKVLQEILDAQIDAVAAEELAAHTAAVRARAAAARAAVQVDLGKLQAIRDAADITRDKLIVEEAEAPVYGADAFDMPAAPITAPTPMAVQPAPITAAPAAEPAPPAGPAAALDANALALLRQLLYGSPFSAPPGVLPSVLIDAINDAFFDEFGDTVIIYEGDAPVLLDDYTDELKGMVKP